MRKILSYLCITTLLFTLNGCKKQEVVVQKQPITLTYYRLYDNAEIFNQSLNLFRSKYPYVTVKIKTFQDTNTYYNTILREIAEGRGPDLFSVPNHWVKSNYKLLTPAPNTLTSEKYQNTFVNVAFQDNAVLQSDNNYQIYGIPYSVDTLGLYYNSKHFEASIPERGKPQNTWSGLTLDSNILTSKQQNEVKKSGLALGDSLSTSRNADVFLLRLLQNDISFYDKTFQQAAFLKKSQTQNIFNEITSFSDPASDNLSWSEKLNSPNRKDKELSAFAQGKSSMLFGYSHLYQDILKKIDLYKGQGLNTISKSDVKITIAPQQAISDNSVTYANYMTEVVSRNTQHKFESWALISELASKPSLELLYKQKFKPTSRRDMIPTQRQNRIYKSFIDQIGFAKSLSLPSSKTYDILNGMFDMDQIQLIQPTQRRQILLKAIGQINKELQTNNTVNPIIKVEPKK